MKEGDHITIVCVLGAATHPVLIDRRHVAVHAHVTNDGHGWIAEEKSEGMCSLVPRSGEGVIWERGWTDGVSLLAAFKLVASTR